MVKRRKLVAAQKENKRKNRKNGWLDNWAKRINMIYVKRKEASGRVEEKRKETTLHVDINYDRRIGIVKKIKMQKRER